MNQIQRSIPCTIVPSLLSLKDKYDGFVFDQFGVIHNGQSLYPNVARTMETLWRGGKKILILTNSGRDEAYNLKRIVGLGIDPRFIEGAVTSGDVAKISRLPEFARKHGRRCLHLASPKEDSSDLSGFVADICLTNDLASCDFVYLSGMPDGFAGEWESRFLPKLLEKKLPLLCSNPDFASPRRSGFSVSPGAIALTYQRRGGQVELVGKPYGKIYEVCLERLALLACRAPLFVGDSYSHDVLGAQGAGCHSFLVLTGVHREMFEDDTSAREIRVTAAARLVEDGRWPTWIAKEI